MERGGAVSADNRLYELTGKRVWVAGHNGMVGSALVRRLQSEGCDVVYAPRSELDLTRQDDVALWMERTRPHAVFVAAAKAGGILANDRFPADFLCENLMIETSIIRAAWKTGVEKLLFLGSSCIYPRLAEQPIAESALLTGPLEPTNEWYAIAKIAGIKLCAAFKRQHGCNFISAMPSNLYGPGDNYDLQTSHVIPALIRKAHDAKIRSDRELVIWGTGDPRREFLHVDDCADALVLVMTCYEDEEHINIGCGEDLPIYDLACLVATVVGFRGAIVCDPSKPDGVSRKLVDSGKLRALGWKPRMPLREGIASTYQEFLKTYSGELQTP